MGLWIEELVKQKLNYIHQNHVKAGFSCLPQEYKYSTAALYAGLESEWDFVAVLYVRAGQNCLFCQRLVAGTPTAAEIGTSC